jgi:adenylate cyclase
MLRGGSSHRGLIVALVRLGRMEEAQAATARLLKIVPDSHLANIRPTSRIPGFAERFLADLRLAGYPE